MPDDPLASALEEIRGLITAKNDLAQDGEWESPSFVTEFDAAQDKLAARVPRLLAALDAVLELTGPSGEIHNDLDGNEEHGLIRVVRCDVLRQAITSALGTVGDSSSEEGGG